MSCQISHLLFPSHLSTKKRGLKCTQSKRERCSSKCQQQGRRNRDSKFWRAWASRSWCWSNLIRSSDCSRSSWAFGAWGHRRWRESCNQRRLWSVVVVLQPRPTERPTYQSRSTNVSNSLLTLFWPKWGPYFYLETQKGNNDREPVSRGLNCTRKCQKNVLIVNLPDEPFPNKYIFERYTPLVY